MRILDQYIRQTVIGYILVSLIVIVALQTFFAFVDEIGAVGQGNYHTINAIQYILMTTPRRIYENLAIACLVGSLLGLGTLATNSELIAIRSAGVSVARIVGSVLKAGLVLVLLSVVMGEMVMPPMERLAGQQKAAAISRKLSVVEDGFWAKDRSSFIHIEKAPSEELLLDTTLYQVDHHSNMVKISQASTATYKNGIWAAEQVTETEFGINRVDILRHQHATWKTDLKPKVFSIVATQPNMLSLLDLYSYINYLEDNELQSSQYRLTFWMKLISPFSTLVMLLLASPFAMGPQRGGGFGQRVFFGILGGIGFFMLNKIFANFALVYKFNPVVCAAAPTLLFMMIGIYGLKRMFR